MERRGLFGGERKKKSGLAVFHRPADRLPSYFSLPRYTKWSIRKEWTKSKVLVVEKMVIL